MFCRGVELSENAGGFMGDKSMLHKHWLCMELTRGNSGPDVYDGDRPRVPRNTSGRGESSVIKGGCFLRIEALIGIGQLTKVGGRRSRR